MRYYKVCTKTAYSYINYTKIKLLNYDLNDIIEIKDSFSFKYKRGNDIKYMYINLNFETNLDFFKLFFKELTSSEIRNYKLKKIL